jgi:exopolysaccharide biosynthesis protein
MKDNKKEVKDVLGRTRIVGSVEWQKGTGTKGSADISATIKPTWSKFGISVKIEVKMKDKQSEHQKLYEQSINQAGGVYIIIRSLGDLMTWYDEFNNNPF